jgi:hypothetical protein
MKFKAQDKQNQLIENISPSHLVVGVDIAQETHVARAVSFRGIALGTPLELGNHHEGFQWLSRWIKDLLKTYQLNKAIVGLEPTGHYWLSLARWLLEKQKENVNSQINQLIAYQTMINRKIDLYKEKRQAELPS